jgi:Ca2+-binding RTX toxin-like protein
MNFESFIRGGFLAGTGVSTGGNGGMPVFDNSGQFSGEEMMMSFGAAATSKYIFMHGALTYNFSSHTVGGTGNTIEYGTRGTGSYDANGYFTGGDVQLRITGLSLSNPAVPTSPANEIDIEASGPIHNFATSHMYGAPGDAARLGKYADALDAYAQNFIGTTGNDIYAGTRFDDRITGNGGSDVFDGGGGKDTIVFSGAKAGYVIATNASGAVTITSASGAVTTLTNIERAQFGNETIELTGGQTKLTLSSSTIAENAGIDTVIGVFAATDPDGVTYTLALKDDAGGRFKLVTAGGVTQLVLAGAIDYETATSHPVTVEIRDSLGAVTTQSFSIDVLDIDEGNAPGIDLSGSSIAEDAGIGAVVGRLSLADAEADDVTWSLSGGAGKFALETNGRGITRLVVDGKLDYETRTSFDITLTATEGEEVTQRSFTIDITDVAETVRGSSGNDRLKGDATPDVLKGGAGNDRLIGGGGADRLSGGGGADTFVFTGLGHSTPDAFDVITDFKGRRGDIIDLSGIDADTGRSGNQSFDFIGRDGFSGTAGELRFEKSNGRTVIEGDVDGDGEADFVLHLLGGVNLKEEFFIV